MPRRPKNQHSRRHHLRLLFNLRQCGNVTKSRPSLRFIMSIHLPPAARAPPHERGRYFAPKHDGFKPPQGDGCNISVVAGIPKYHTLYFPLLWHTPCAFTNANKDAPCCRHTVIARAARATAAAAANVIINRRRSRSCSSPPAPILGRKQLR